MTLPKNAKIEISIGLRRSSSSGESSKAVIEIEDEPSGEKLAVIELSSEQFLRLLSGHGIMHADAFVSNNLQRVGRQMKHRTIKVPRDVVTTYDRKAATSQARSYAGDFMEVGEQADIPRLDNKGEWSVTVRRWE